MYVCVCVCVCERERHVVSSGGPIPKYFKL